jgi:hypothetical protein
MSNIDRIPRPEKLRIAHLIGANLTARQAAGPAEPALDKFIAELASAEAALASNVTGKSTADAARLALLATQDACDDEVDVRLRHLESFLHAESHRRHGPHVSAALAVYQGAFPDGLAHIDDRIVVENAHCRAALVVLRDPVHAATVAAVGLPSGWLDAFAKALDASDAATVAVDGARLSKSSAVEGGQSAEEQWAGVITRLRDHVKGRDGKAAEGKQLLAPLIAANALINAQTAARRTHKAKADPTPAPAPK